MVERRLLRGLKDHRERKGAYATRWEGWKTPLHRSFATTGQKYVSEPWASADVLDKNGCYAILYQPSPYRAPKTLYVAYLGSSGETGRELRRRQRKFDVAEDRRYPISAIYVSGRDQYLEYEDDLLRYYNPPWNRKFSK